MNQNKKAYCSPKFEIVAFDEEDILTVSTWGNNTGDNEEGENGGSGSEIDFEDLGWL